MAQLAPLAPAVRHVPDDYRIWTQYVDLDESEQVQVRNFFSEQCLRVEVAHWISGAIYKLDGKRYYQLVNGINCHWDMGLFYKDLLIPFYYPDEVCYISTPDVPTDNLFVPGTELFNLNAYTWNQFVHDCGNDPEKAYYVFELCCGQSPASLYEELNDG